MRLLYAIEHQKGAAMLTGEVGCGKTTVTRALNNYLGRDRYQFQTISNPALQPTDFLKAILLKFGEYLNTNSKALLLDKLQNLLLQNAKNGISTVLAIDEAHVIENRKTLDELRMILNFQLNDEFLITLILIGQPPLLQKMSELQPLQERISIKFNLDPLNNKDTLRYVTFRLESAGATREIFSREALDAIYGYSGGIPLRINNLCDRCLLTGLLQKTRLVDSRIVEDAIEDIGS